MRVDGKPTPTIWPAADESRVTIMDQTRLPHEFVICELATLGDFEVAIREMKVRGAPLIGVTAAYGLAIALRDDPSDAGARARKRETSGDAADSRQPCLGARCDARSPLLTADRGAGRRRLCRGRRTRR